MDDYCFRDYDDECIDGSYKSDSKYVSWIDKFKPSSFDDIVSQEIILNTIDKLILSQTLSNFIFYGPPGTGKTSTILAVVDKLYGQSSNYMIMNINASENRGVNTIRKEIHKFVSSKHIFCFDGGEDKYKLVILDEADAMTNNSQILLRKIIDDYSVNVKFCLICNYIEKIDPSLQSRFIKFKFTPLNKQIILDRIKIILDKENVIADEEGINLIIKNSNGDMRNILNIVQSIHMTNGIIDKKSVEECSSNIDEEQMNFIISTCVNESVGDSFVLLKDYIRKEYIEVLNIALNVKSLIIDEFIMDSSSSCFSNGYIGLSNLTDKHKLLILSKINNICNNQFKNTSGDIQLCYLIGLIKFGHLMV